MSERFLTFLRYAKHFVRVRTTHDFAVLVLESHVWMPIYAPSYGDDLSRSEGTINMARQPGNRNGNWQFFLSGWRLLRFRSGVKWSDEAH